jgi:hypothetical protein
VIAPHAIRLRADHAVRRRVDRPPGGAGAPADPEQETKGSSSGDCARDETSLKARPGVRRSLRLAHQPRMEKVMEVVTRERNRGASPPGSVKAA